jgi:hypothetical protein
MKKTTVFDSMQAAAGARQEPLSALERDKAAGCPAFRGGRVYNAELDSWRAKQKRQQAKPMPAAVAAPTPDATTGTPAALRRLEQAERDAYAGMQNALAAGDTSEGERRRKAWLETSEALRRADLSLEAARRDSGELVVRKDVEKAMWLLHFYLNAVWVQSAQRAMVDIRRTPGMGAQTIFDVLDRNLRFGPVTSAAAGMAAADAKIPSWMVAAATAFWRGATHPQITSEAQELADLLRGAITRSTPEPQS